MNADVVLDYKVLMEYMWMDVSITCKSRRSTSSGVGIKLNMMGES